MEKKYCLFLFCFWLSALTVYTFIFSRFSILTVFWAFDSFSCCFELFLFHYAGNCCCFMIIPVTPTLCFFVLVKFSLYFSFFF